jgi:hypothetical protein
MPSSLPRSIDNCGLEVRELRHCLEERSQSNVKLEKLNILRCGGICNDDIQCLREIVDVEWDGIATSVEILDGQDSLISYLWGPGYG